MVSYVVSLRGPEGFLLYLGFSHQTLGKGSSKYLIVALLGKIKGEHHDVAHLIPCTHMTDSGIGVYKSLDKLIREKKSRTIIDGSAISSSYGLLLSTQTINDMLIDVLQEIYEEDATVFPADVDSKDSLGKFYQCYRTFRNTSNTRALERKVSPSDIDVVNRWRSVEQAKGKRPSRQMKQHYAQLELLICPFLRYTNKM